MPIEVIKSRCPANHSCPAVKVCPVNALLQEGYNVPNIDKEKCIDCNKCVKKCPKGSLQAAK